MIAMEETKIFQWTHHKSLWLWLAENPEKKKSQWPRWRHRGGDVDEVSLECFACDGCDDCDSCPLVWSNVICGDSEFGQWEYTDDLELRSTLALTIAYLPVKPRVLCI